MNNNAEFERVTTAKWILFDSMGFPEEFPSFKDAKDASKYCSDGYSIHKLSKEVTTITRLEEKARRLN